MDNIEAIFKQWEEVPGSEAVLREVAELMRSCKSWEEVQEGLTAMIRGAQTTLSEAFDKASEGQAIAPLEDGTHSDLFGE